MDRVEFEHLTVVISVTPHLEDEMKGRAMKLELLRCGVAIGRFIIGILLMSLEPPIIMHRFSDVHLVAVSNWVKRAAKLEIMDNVAVMSQAMILGDRFMTPEHSQDSFNWLEQQAQVLQQQEEAVYEDNEKAVKVTDGSFNAFHDTIGNLDFTKEIDDGYTG